MSRNMIKANEYIFDTLASFVNEKNTERYIPPNRRCIETDDIEKDWLKKLTINKIKPILPNFKTACFEFDNFKYFAVSGWEGLPDVEYDALELMELNAGIVTALLFELEIPIGKNVRIQV